jgi:hypothetical protein
MLVNCLLIQLRKFKLGFRYPGAIVFIKYGLEGKTEHHRPVPAAVFHRIAEIVFPVAEQDYALFSGRFRTSGASDPANRLCAGCRSCQFSSFTTLSS